MDEKVRRAIKKRIYRNTDKKPYDNKLSKHDNLAEYGDTFEVVSYDGKEGYFKLIGNAPQAEDDIIDVPEEITDPEEFDNSEEVDMNDFELEL